MMVLKWPGPVSQWKLAHQPGWLMERDTVVEREEQSGKRIKNTVKRENYCLIDAIKIKIVF